VARVFDHMIKNVELAIGDYVIDTSGGNYVMRDFILSHFATPVVNESPSSNDNNLFVEVGNLAQAFTLSNIKQLQICKY